MIKKDKQSKGLKMITINFKKEIQKNVVQIFATNKPELKTNCLTPAQKKYVAQALKQCDFKAKEGEIVSVLGLEEKILVVGTGECPNRTAFEKIGGKLAAAVKDEKAAYYPLNAKNLSEEINAVATGLFLASFKFDKYLSKKKNEKELKDVTFVCEDIKGAKKQFEETKPILESVCFARALSAEPANHLTPLIFSKLIEKLADTGLEIEILSLKELKSKKFGMLLSVAQGSQNEPKVAIMKWMGNPKKKTFDIGFVGKGVTFDSGGISLKPGAGMGDMKQDMTGAAVVVSSMRSFALRKVKNNVIGIVGLVENMPSGSASRPGDIVTSLSGKTVEILNTDAEGRLVLGDCLWYMQQVYKVKKIIDLATLTGAVMAALGEEYAGLFSYDDKLVEEIISAGKSVDEEVWRLPMNKAYDKMIDSDIADMKNIGGRLAGGSTAACFLHRFIKEGTSWAHLDIAGVDKYEKSRPITPKGATGWGVRLLNELVK